MAAPIDSLRNVPLFAELEDRELAQLAGQMHERRFPEGAEVTSEGAGGAGFFVIAEGNADVAVGGAHKASIGPGDFFGEIALIDTTGKRTASIVAATDLLCYGLTPWEFRPFVEEHSKVAWALLQTLAKRLREAQSSQ
jgi:CRP/FNR family transcriptional regulator, cyclic AMP receptor protein